MLYATLEEAYNITSFKKPKKKKPKDVESTSDIHPYDKYDDNISELGSSRKTTSNHCDPLQAPPYIFPIEKKAKDQYEQALKDMNRIDTKIESNMGDELDSYLDEYDEYNEYNPEEIDRTDRTERSDNTDKTERSDRTDVSDKIEKTDRTERSDKTDKFTEKSVKVNKKKTENTLSSDKVLERIYELIILLLLAFLIILMCEVIVRIAKN